MHIRASMLGKIMTDPTAAAIKAGEVLSQGAKTAIRDLAAQDILGIQFEVDAKALAKGIECEDEAIMLLNRVTGRMLVKNSERRTNDWITGECDLYEPGRGFDLKCAWSAATFPILPEDIGGSQRTLYEWQCRAYMMLWDADEWIVSYVLINTPERLIGYESVSMHVFDHIPEHMRLTQWVIKRDKALEDKIAEKVMAARAYYAQVVEEFSRAIASKSKRSQSAGIPSRTPYCTHCLPRSARARNGQGRSATLRPGSASSLPPGCVLAVNPSKFCQLWTGTGLMWCSVALHR